MIRHRRAPRKAPKVKQNDERQIKSASKTMGLGLFGHGAIFFSCASAVAGLVAATCSVSARGTDVRR